MQVFRNLDAFPDVLRGGVVSLGKYDGVHPGHVMTIRRVKEHAARLGVPAIVMTFDPPPIRVLRPDLGQRPICTLQRKIELIQTLEPDALVVLPATRLLLEQNAETFFFDTFKKRLGAKAVVEGRNFTFGCNQSGNAGAMRLYGRLAGVEVCILDPIGQAGRTISSSGIRSLIRDGNVAEANKLMPKPYRMTGVVVAGDRRGRMLGFPTANLDSVETIIPHWGLYATVAIVDGKRYASTTHVGPNPTFDATRVRIETFIHDFDGDLYGKSLDVDVHAWLRDSIRFDSTESLVRQMTRDVQQSEEITASVL